MLEYDWLLTALIYGLIGSPIWPVRLHVFVMNRPNRAVKQPIKITSIMPLAKTFISKIIAIKEEHYGTYQEAPGQIHFLQ